MGTILGTPFSSNGPVRPGADPLLSPEDYEVQLDDRVWGEPNLLPLVTVKVGDGGGRSLVRFTDTDALESLSDEQWAVAREMAERFAVRIDDGDNPPCVCLRRTLVVAVPNWRVAERLARFFLTLAMPTGRIP